MTTHHSDTTMRFSYTIETSIRDIEEASWKACAQNAPPFLDYQFLLALEESHSVGGDSGWDLKLMVVWHKDVAVALLPMYQKSHSYGEYVFDHAWANAYQQHQLEYYPKLLVAVPFTPVTANKLLISPGYESAEMDSFVLQVLKQYCQSEAYSSVHWLYAVSHQLKNAIEQQYCQRLSVQFEWKNQNYANFDDFLSRFTSRKRKDIRKERRRLIEQGVEIRSLSGKDVSEDDMSFFYQCYRQTYLKRSGHAGYLTRRFFEHIYAKLGGNLFLVIAYQESQPIAAAFYLYNNTGLYGRYWGALKDVDGLHFECCYYAGIEFAIEKKLPIFNPGTQGEHKLLRGFEPMYCQSLHYLVEPAFHAAVENYVEQERHTIEHYFRQTTAVVPFKKTQSDNDSALKTLGT